MHQLQIERGAGAIEQLQFIQRRRQQLGFHQVGQLGAAGR